VSGKQLISTITLLLLALVVTSGQAKLFVPDLEPWDIWAVSDENNTDRIDHSEWQSILDTYLLSDTADGINRFRYAAVSETHRRRLQDYLDGLARIDPRIYPLAEQRAYWINLYNALTIQLVLAHYPVKSIRKIFGGILASGPWDEKLIEVTGIPLSLNDIEHRILRPIWRDPRIHYAVNCASLGCPNLATRAFTAANSEHLLDAGARAYINHPRGVSIHKDRLTASSIYDWYDTDFGDSMEGLRQHWLLYATPELKKQLGDYQGKIRYDYDWKLNRP